MKYYYDIYLSACYVHAVTSNFQSVRVARKLYDIDVYVLYS